MNRESFVPVVGINQRRSSAAPAGSREATCFSNCGQSPPEITATSVTASNRARVAAISSDSGRFLSARVPSRSDRQSGVKGRSVSVRLVVGGLLLIQKTHIQTTYY